MGVKSEPRVRPDIHAGGFGRYGLPIRGVRQRLRGDMRGKCTPRNVSANAVASSEDKCVGEVSSLDIMLEIDDVY